MKFKVDENLPVEITEILRKSNYDAKTVIEQGHPGLTVEAPFDQGVKPRRIGLRAHVHVTNGRSRNPVPAVAQVTQSGDGLAEKVAHGLLVEFVFGQGPVDHYRVHPKLGRRDRDARGTRLYNVEDGLE